MRIVTVMDNLPSEQKALTAEHGLSFFVDTGKVKLLFDFGASPCACENGKKLNIPLNQIQYAIGSHGHYDHGAGYREFVAQGLTCPLLTGKGYFQEKYAYDGVKATYLGVGFDQGWIKTQGIKHQECDGVLQFEDGCYLVGNVKNHYDFETIPKRFVLKENEKWVQDTFSDEVCLVLDWKDGQIVILGCSHPGVLNMLHTVKEHFHKPIHAVFGGTHLVEADEKRIEETIQIMKTMGIGLLGFNHCSGGLLREMLCKEEELKTCYLGVGDCMYL